jgi:hypothetical protein
LIQGNLEKSSTIDEAFEDSFNNYLCKQTSPDREKFEKTFCTGLNGLNISTELYPENNLGELLYSCF